MVLQNATNIPEAEGALSLNNISGTLDETKGGTGAATYTTGDTLYASGSNTLAKLPAGSDGQVLTLSSSIPAWVSPGVFSEQTSSFSMVPGGKYIAYGGTLIVATLPTTCAVGQTLKIVGKGAGGWRVAQNSGQDIYYGNSLTTNGTGGRLDSTDVHDCVELVCTTANTTFTVASAVGTILIT